MQFRVVLVWVCIITFLLALGSFGEEKLLYVFYVIIGAASVALACCVYADADEIASLKSEQQRLETNQTELLKRIRKLEDSKGEQSSK
jgi:hypothetical protein